MNQLLQFSLLEREDNQRFYLVIIGAHRARDRVLRTSLYTCL